MKTIFAIAILVLVLVSGTTTLAQETKAISLTSTEQSEMKFAGIEVNKEFLVTAANTGALSTLLKSDLASAGAVCKIECGQKVGGIVCDIGEMCSCSCPGGGPDCSCRDQR